MTIIYIVPATTDLGGQCRIVAAHGNIASPRDDYRKTPGRWKEVGLMNAAGRLVYLQASPEIYADIKACEPLMAGVFFRYEEEGGQP
ncbi:MAG: hypothetical protein M1492_07980 [Gammaproteobacteria bacterium]|nr:hypothetical protein [Gammaproteobacteria bacterium]